MKINLPLYNDAGLRELPTLLPFLEPDDTLMLVSGNMDKPLDLAWLERTLTQIRRDAPQTVLLATAGLANLEKLAQEDFPSGGLVYIYEPDFPNVPEFSWEAGATLTNIARAAEITEATPFGFKPTGRPLFQKGLERYAWDYGAFAAHVDLLLVQTQTYCKNGAFEGAVHKLGLQCRNALAKTFAQITLDLNARNGVEAVAGSSCTRAIASSGLAGVTLWGSPHYTDNTLRLLDLLRQRA